MVMDYMDQLLDSRPKQASCRRFDRLALDCGNETSRMHPFLGNSNLPKKLKHTASPVMRHLTAPTDPSGLTHQGEAGRLQELANFPARQICECFKHCSFAQ